MPDIRISIVLVISLLDELTKSRDSRDVVLHYITEKHARVFLTRVSAFDNSTTAVRVNAK